MSKRSLMNPAVLSVLLLAVVWAAGCASRNNIVGIDGAASGAMPPSAPSVNSNASTSGGGWTAADDAGYADYNMGMMDMDKMEEEMAMEYGGWGEVAIPQEESALYGDVYDEAYGDVYDETYDTYDTYDAYGDAAYNTAESAVDHGAGGTDSAASSPGGSGASNVANNVAPSINPEKIIQTAGIDLQTDRFDEAVDRLRGVATDYGGYVESANLYGNDRNRYFNITLRVPTERFEAARKQVETVGHLTNAWQNAEDVTAQYYDIVSRLETKRIEEERVLDMITRATKIDDLLSLERRLGEIRTQIERYESRMTAINRLAAYSTIHVGLAEVSKEELIVVSDNLGGRMQRAFIRSVNNTAIFFQEVIIFLAGAFIPLTAVGLVVFVGIKTAFAVHDKNKNKKR